MRPAMRDQVDHRVGRAADRGVGADRVLERLARQDLRQREVLLRPSRRCAARPCARARCGARRPPGSRRCPAARCRAPRPCEAIVEAVPIVMQWPCERCMHALGLVEFVLRHLAGAQRPRDIARRWCPSRCRSPRYLPDSIGPPETPMVGRSHARRAHQQRRRGLVAAHQQHDAVDRVARGSTPRRPCWRGCGTASRSAAAASRRATSPGTRAGSRRPRARPACTCSASTRKCALQGVSSDQVLQMPMTGRPSNWSCGMPRFFIQRAVDEADRGPRGRTSSWLRRGFAGHGGDQRKVPAECIQPHPCGGQRKAVKWSDQFPAEAI